MPDKHDISRDKKGRWKTSGNPKGRPKKKLCMSDILKEYGERISKKEPHYNILQLVGKKVYEMAIGGNMRAIEFITERLEGKVPIVEIKKETELPFDRIIFNECQIPNCHCKNNCIDL
mgnify:CR=1 FL=1